MSSVLVVGATGKQGGAVVKALLASTRPSAAHTSILALTRDTTSARSQSLAALPRVQLVQGDARAPDAIFASLPTKSVTDLFLVTTPPDEEPQAVPFIDAAIAHGVRNIVFTSVDRGGPDASWTTPTDVPHFAAKHNIEQHLVHATKGTGVTWTILRPVAFMDNLAAGGTAGVLIGMWSISLRPTTRLQQIATSDIGRWAADAILARADANAAESSAEPTAYTNKAFSLAGSDTTLDETRAAFRRAVGRDMPRGWWLPAKLLLFFVKDMGYMFRWFERDGYGVDIAALRRDGPGPPPMTLDEYLRNESGWLKK